MCAEKLIAAMGADRALLETRSRVLQAVGYQVCQATSIVEVKKALAGRQVDLLLLCHTLPRVDCQRAIAALRKVDSKVKAIILVPFSGRSPIKDEGVVFHQVSGPRQLVDTVQSVLPSK